MEAARGRRSCGAPARGRSASPAPRSTSIPILPPRRRRDPKEGSLPANAISKPPTLPPWAALPLALAADAERLCGADGEAMLYLPATRRYVRLGIGTARLLDALDGSMSTTELLARTRADSGRAARVLAALDALRRAGAFTLDPGPRRRSRSGAWLTTSPRLPVTAGFDRLVAGPARLIGRAPRTSAATAALAAVAALALATVALVRYPDEGTPIWPLVVVVLLAETVAHELAHAAVCRALGVRIREAGLMLWGWFLPLAYVDCTDVYRLRARRARVLVALVGPLVDLLAAGCAAAVFLRGGGSDLRGTTFTILLSQLIVLARNLAPLPPADGYHALAAATGELNLRGHAVAELRAFLASAARSPRRRALAGTPAGAAPADRPRWLYAGYGTLVAVYVAALLAALPLELQALAEFIG